VNEIKEVLVQLYAYAGFPRSLNAISSLENVVAARKAKGINDPEGKAATTVSFTPSKFSYGKDVQTKLTGSTATGAPQRFVPVIDTFLKEHLFADVFSRDILDYKTREIATISALASMSGLESQLKSHLNVGRNVGLSEAQLRRIAFLITTRVGWQQGNTVSGYLDSMFKTSNSQMTATSVEKVTFPNREIAVASNVFARGGRIVSKNFTGTVHLNMLVDVDSIYYVNVGNVSFQPGARSNWHLHPGGQILLVTVGKGYYQEKGKPKRMIHAGDVVKCPPDVLHWHGATPVDSMVHIAIGPNQDNGSVLWQEAVSDSIYHSAL
jgi:quercetin dioxygenase-like cupin family protein/alkylhydroperoxidase/carboxymuconolactone decarboxylase family protein YurZ